MLRRALCQASPTRLFASRVWAKGAWAAGGGCRVGSGGGGGRGFVVDVASRFSQSSIATKAMSSSSNPSLLWASLESARHDAGGNHERPDRVVEAVEGLIAALENDNELASLSKRVDLEKNDGVDLDDARSAAEAVHSRDYLARLSALCLKASKSPDGTLKVADEDDVTEFTYVTQSSVDDALQALATALGLWKELSSPSSSSSPKAALALVRPPGHHAGRGIDSVSPDSPAGAPSGFCLMNTVAAVARRIASSPSEEVNGKRVLVVDFDVHVGDGTQDIFWGRDGSEDEEQVCVVDLHECGAWPGGGGIELKGERGKTPPLFGGLNRIVNVPLPATSGDAAARAAFERVVVPVAKRFRPHAIVASAGFDAHALEPLAGLRWADETYEYLGARLVALAQEQEQQKQAGDESDKDENGKVLFVLEGGYSRQALRSAVAALARGAATMQVPDSPSRDLDEAAEAMIRAVVEEHEL